MSENNPLLPAGSYRLQGGIRLEQHGEQILALSDYPLRVVRLKPTMARLLALCTEPRTCMQLAEVMKIPLKRVEALCDQLRWKGLLEAGPLLPPATWPTVSIIIPAYNRVCELGRCLQSLLLQDYPARLEIIVVDDASTDNTCIMMEQYIQKKLSEQVSLRLVRHRQRCGIGTSRNDGAAIAQHELLAYIDSDCVASSNWLRELVPAFQQLAIGAVGGMIRAYERESLLGRYEDVRSSLFMGQRPQQVKPEGPLTYLPTASFLVRRSLWQQLGGFASISLGEDVDFCRRLLTSGAGILYLPQGVVYHDYRTTLPAFLRTRVAYASSEASLLLRHAVERRVLLLPPEPAIFAMSLIMGTTGIAYMSMAPTRGVTTLISPRRRRNNICSDTPCGCHARCHASRYHAIPQIFPFLIAVITCLVGSRRRLKALRVQQVPLGMMAVLKATVRGNLSYTYHLCRHLTRYYTLPALLIGLFMPPLFMCILLMCAVVIGVDYVRLQPQMRVGAFALCAMLDDCAYEIGVAQGCIQRRTWKPLIPIIKNTVRT